MEIHSRTMSYASAMGARVGLVYDARDEDWDCEISDDSMSAPEPELPQMCTVSLPPFGLPPISSRKDSRSPPTDPLTQRLERVKVSESVMKKYDVHMKSSIHVNYTHFKVTAQG